MDILGKHVGKEMSEMVERIARAIAKRHGDDFDAIPADKYEWTQNHGQFGGRFRDVNEPYKVDYLDMAAAAIEAMREPTDAMCNAPTWYDGDESFTPGDAKDVWDQMIDEALK